jgi:heparosan-N-sulfate-glucuronate 5-epimerase
MKLLNRIPYFWRIFSAYAMPTESHLTFWHEAPESNPSATGNKLGEYYMTFREKADYAGERDQSGIPRLNYRGRIGLQYNPIAIAQWGLGNYNCFSRNANELRRKNFLAASDWLCDNIKQNAFGVWVWNHDFDWEYRTLLKAPWYSGLAQGQGISLLLRAHQSTGVERYLDIAKRAFSAFEKSTADGGVAFTDPNGNLWFEEYVVSPPTHILNGFIWAIWGVYDYVLATGSSTGKALFESAVQTLRANLDRYDLRFWSLYEQSGTLLPMVASSFYHRLHIVQLRIMYRITGEEIFLRFADRWQAYTASPAKRTRALCCKSVFKLCYY